MLIQEGILVLLLNSNNFEEISYSHHYAVCLYLL